MEDPVWETSKENVQPLKRGRSLSALKAAMEAAEKDKDAKRRMFEEEIQSERDIDKQLTLWNSYITWLEDMYASGSPEILNALESATAAFLTVPRLKNNPQYVGLWMKYAERVSDPAEIFSFLRGCGIGICVASLWLGSAWAEERRGQWRAAEAAYREGIARNAAPIAAITTRYREFQRRAVKQWVTYQEERGVRLVKADVRFEDVDLAAISAKVTATAPANAENAAARGTLAHISERAAARTHRDGLTTQEVVRMSERASAGMGQQMFGRSAPIISAPKPQQHSSNSNKDIAIFTDEEFSAPATGFSRPVPSLTDTSKRAEWKSLGTMAERHKENTQQAAQWAGTIVPQHEGVIPAAHPEHTAARAPAASVENSRVQVFVDDDFTVPEPRPMPKPQARLDMPLRPVVEPARTFNPAAAMARARPPTVVDAKPAAAPLAAPAPLAGPVRPAQENSLHSQAKPSVSASADAKASSPQAKFVSPLLSYEEERAVHWCTQRGLYTGSWQSVVFPSSAVPPSPEVDGMDVSLDAERPDRTAQTQELAALMTALGAEKPKPRPLEARIVAAPLSPVSPIPQERKRAVFKSVARGGRASIGSIDSPILPFDAADEDVTVHTKFALSDMAELFSSPSLARAMAKPQPKKRELPPDARRLSMHLAARATHEPLRPNFEIFQEDVPAPQPTRRVAKPTFSIFSDS